MTPLPETRSGQVFVDTGAWLAIAVKRDQYHKVAADYYRQLSHRRISLITTNYVLQETYTRIRYDDGHNKAIQFHKIITEAIQKGRLRVEWITPSVHEEAWTFFKNYPDHAFSFVDCTSFVVAKEVRAQTVFGFDAFFKIIGFTLEPVL